MARPHIEFIHEQVLPWSEGLNGGSRPGVSVRRLSADDETGGSSLVIRYPPGWRRMGPEHLTTDEEFIVLSGSLEINGRTYDQLAYGFFPAGYVRTSSSSLQGALVLTFFESEPQAVPGEPAQPLSAGRAVEYSIPHEMLLLDLYAALRPIDAITGATTADDILNRIFSTFCIGK